MPSGLKRQITLTLPLITIVRCLLGPHPPLHFRHFVYVFSREHGESFARMFSSLKCRLVTFSVTWDSLTGNIRSVRLDHSRDDTCQICIRFTFPIRMRPESDLGISDSMCFFSAYMHMVQIRSVPHRRKIGIGLLEPCSINTA